jgi:predicted  nucleic acid-binding Zn-ribbon protein
MPHQCTSCGHVFADGSKEMLSGCPDCGGTKFQFHPEGADIPEQPTDAEPPERPEEESVAGTVGSAAATVKNLVGGSGAPDDEKVGGVAFDDSATASSGTAGDAAVEPTDTAAGDAAVDAKPTAGADVDAGPTAGADADAGATPGAEDAAQASARTDVVSRDELPEHDGSPPPVEDGTVVDEPDDDRPDLSELREELNSQFESIKVVEPGQYELNLMELYDREEYIIAMQEDGKYSIQVPETWRE